MLVCPYCEANVPIPHSAAMLDIINRYGCKECRKTKRWSYLAMGTDKK